MNRAIKIVNTIGLEKFDGDNYWLRPFKNGRENGIAIVVPAKGLYKNKIIAFAEHRNDDSITSIYVGEENQFSDDGTLFPSDETMWYCAKTFPLALMKITEEMSSTVTRRCITIE